MTASKPPCCKALLPSGRRAAELAELEGAGPAIWEEAEEAEKAAAKELTAEEKAAEELNAVIDTFKHQMHQIYVASQAAEQQVGRLLTRAKEETAPVVVEPLRPRPAMAAWLAARGLPADPSLEECMTFCLDAAESHDLETRTILFTQDDAAVLTRGQRRVTVFDMLRLIPALFH